MRRVRPKHPSQRETRNVLEFWGGGTVMEAPKRTGRQPEANVNDAIAKWRNLKPGLVLERNKRRLATPPGMHKPIMLGWLCDGSADWIGYRRVIVTAAMVGKPIAQFVALESKRPDGGVVSDEQEAFLNALKDAGGVAAVVRSADDAERALGEDIYQRWLRKQEGQ